jgi:hypothetical protein
MDIKLDLLTHKDIVDISKSSQILSDITFTDYAKDSKLENSEIIWTRSSLIGKVVTAQLPENNVQKRIVISMGDASDYDKGILPVIKDSESYKQLCELFNDADEIEFGEYPMTEVNDNSMLNEALINGNLLETDRLFNKSPEYYYDGNKYVKRIIIHNGSKPHNHFYKVEPIKWINIRNKKMFVCKNVLYCDSFNFNSYHGNFKNTYMYKKLESMYREMTAKVNYSKELLLTENDKSNPLKFQFLSKEDIFGEKALSMKNLIGIYISDFADYLGCYANYIKGEIITDYESKNVGYYPVIDYSLIKDKCKVTFEGTDFLKVTYGEYPTKRLYGTAEFNHYLETHNPIECATGKTYSINANFDNNSKEFKLQELKEYKIYGGKYVKVNDDVWFLVTELEWGVELKRNLAVCLDTLFAGIDYDLTKDIYESELNRFIIKYFAKEIIPSKSRNVDKINDMISNDIALQMLMNKQNLTIEDLELDSESKLVLRR